MLIMEAKVLKTRHQSTRAVSVSIPAPVGGWNARESLAAMKPEDAVEMINYFPKTTTAELRKGWLPHSYPITGQVETLMAYSGGIIDRMFGATSNGYIYDTTTPTTLLIAEDTDIITTEDDRSIALDGAGSPAATLSGLTNGRWQWVNFRNTGGSFLCIVNGADYYRVFDGTSWYVDGGGTYDITGLDTRTATNIHVFKRRLWFTEAGTLKAWYLPVDAIAGAAASLDMSSLCQFGGYLMAMGTWTLDAGYGVDDYAVWITNRGEVIVWRMTDPTDANSIFFIGLWELGAPIGRRCMTKWMGDLLVITHDGVVPLAQALQSSRLDPRVNLTDKIQQAISGAISAYSGNFGWELTLFPRQNMLILNVPVQEGTAQEQYVMNTITKSWCKFTALEANTWVLYQDDLYFGANNIIANALTGYNDNTDEINGRFLQAFNYFGEPGVRKRFTLMRPTFYTNGEPDILANINTDFDQSLPVYPLDTAPQQGALWDVDLWDVGEWALDPEVVNPWQGCVAEGFCGGVRLSSSTSGMSIGYVSTEIVYEPGGIL